MGILAVKNGQNVSAAIVNYLMEMEAPQDLVVLIRQEGTQMIPVGRVCWDM